MDAAFPWVVPWDDHEVDNNYAGDHQEAGMPREAFLLRRAAACQACWEHMPLRRTAVPSGRDMQIYPASIRGPVDQFRRRWWRRRRPDGHAAVTQPGREVDYVTKPGAPLVTRATFVVENGQPGAKTIQMSSEVISFSYINRYEKEITSELI